MGADERFELREELCLAAQRKVGLNPPLERGQVCGLELLNVSLRERVICEVCEGFAAPERECFPQEAAGAVGVAAFRVRNQLLEAQQVELPCVDPDRSDPRL